MARICDGLRLLPRGFARSCRLRSVTPLNASSWKPHTDLLLTATWNIAAINNNPLEYWTTYDALAYKQLMDDMETLIEDPAIRDVPLEQVLPADVFDELIALMAALNWEGVDEVVKLWNSDLKQRPIVSGFLKDKAIGSKKLASIRALCCLLRSDSRGRCWSMLLLHVRV